MSGAYYNEIDPFAAAWLRELICEGQIAAGDVDERSIEDVEPQDLQGYAQCHFFAGIGGWSYALRLAGWPDDRPVWTGSCPCQPFSAAGKGGGFDDERHLWPYWHWLVAQCRPAVVFGEQVASKGGLEWFDLVHADLENEGYAVGAADLCAAGVGAPHIRQRLWWVADAVSTGRPEGRPIAGNGSTPWSSFTRKLGDAGRTRLQERECDGDVQREALGPPPRQAAERASDSFWSNPEWLPCSDGKARPVEPGIFPLAHGILNRVGTLRGAGGAIVPQVAAEFVTAFQDVSAWKA